MFGPAPHTSIAGDQRRTVVFPASGSAGYDGPRVLLASTAKVSAVLREQWRQQSSRALVACEIRIGKTGAVQDAGTPEDWQRLMLERCIDEVHVEAGASQGERALVSALGAAAKGLGLPLVVYDRKAAISGTGRLQGVHTATHGIHAGVKRAIDLLIASAMLLASLPLFALIALAIKLTSPGPVFFLQPRVGRGRRQFAMFKFRTMVKNAEELRHAVQSLNHAKGISFKVIGDPRVTRVGGWLRRSSLDELPQLLNVIRGEMSLVGPRPIPVWVAEQLQELSYFRRFSVMPGLTGLWQVNGRIQDFDRMAGQDLEYVDKWSLALDLKLLARTLPAVLGAEGAN